MLKLNENCYYHDKAIYTAACVAGSWAGGVISWAGAVMSGAGAVMSWAGAVKAIRKSGTDQPTN